MKTIIIEDEPLVAKDLQKLLQQIDPTIEVVSILDSLFSSISYFSKNSQPDLLFMDIQLSDGVSFELFKQIQINCPIIFTTAYNEYAIRAFKVNSIGYLLKPIDKNELKAALDKYQRIQLTQGAGFKNQLQQLISQFNLPSNTKIFKERFTVHSGKSFFIINEKDIACFQKDTLIYIITNDNQRYITDFQTMDEIEELLNPKFFFRANRQLIIRSTSFNGFKSDMYGKLVLALLPPVNISVDISREKAQAFKHWIE